MPPLPETVCGCLNTKIPRNCWVIPVVASYLRKRWLWEISPCPYLIKKVLLRFDCKGDKAYIWKDADLVVDVRLWALVKKNRSRLKRKLDFTHGTLFLKFEQRTHLWAELTFDTPQERSLKDAFRE
jgi:hypothetical protein